MQYKILIANGVNLDLLGARPEQWYGTGTLEQLEDFLVKKVPEIEKLTGHKITLSFFQSNEEGSFLNKLSEKWHGAVINPGAWTHSSLALADRLESLQLPFAEVHLSNLSKRTEPWRKKSYSAVHALGVIYGFGFESYFLGLQAVISALANKGK